MAGKCLNSSESFFHLVIHFLRIRESIMAFDMFLRVFSRGEYSESMWDLEGLKSVEIGFARLLKAIYDTIPSMCTHSEPYTRQVRIYKSMTKFHGQRSKENRYLHKFQEDPS